MLAGCVSLVEGEAFSPWLKCCGHFLLSNTTIQFLEQATAFLSLFVFTKLLPNEERPAVSF